MARLERLDRRTFVRQVSRTAVGFVVLGVAASACGGADEPGARGTAGTGGGSGAGGAWRTVDLGPVAAYVLVRAGEAVVVDTGLSGSEDAIGRVLDSAGSGWNGVAEVILTHRHPDHAGSIAAILGLAPEATAYAGELDIPAITSPRDLVALRGGEVVSGLEIVATPGHTAGHISVFDPDSRTLVAGDALNGDGSGGLAGPNPQYSQDMDQAWGSVAALARRDLDLAAILPGHGGTVTQDAATKLAGLVAQR